MSEQGLTADELRKRYAAEIAEGSTFETRGVSLQAVKDYLDTAEGTRYWQSLAEADPGASTSVIDDRAIEQITSGRELPRMELSDEPLFKIVPVGNDVPSYSPFFAKRSAFEDALASGHNLSDYFGLPIKSEGGRYDVYQIQPKASTEAFVHRVAPTSELGGLVTKAGGGEQVLVPNRALYEQPTYLKSLDNRMLLKAERSITAGVSAAPVAKGLAVAGAAAVVYDTAITAQRTSDLLHDGNSFGAQSEILHFGSRNLGMLGGAELGFGAGAALGVESGPGLFVTGTIGVVVGAIGGDKIAKAIDNHRIYTQDDKYGKTWHFDPDQLDQGWTRAIESSQVDINPGDSALRPFAHRSHIISADATLNNELNYKASGSVVQMALDHAALPQDPYIVPTSSQDTPSLRASPWLRDATTHQWTREVATGLLEHGMVNAHLESATPQRAAELDRAAEAILAKNATETKQAIAAGYQSAYERYGWKQFGAPPEAVTHALRVSADKQLAPNGDSYTRGADDQWTTPHWYGDDTARGNLKAELNDARQRQAHARSPGLTASFKDIDHPEHGLYAKLKDVMPEQTSEARLAQATAACHTHGITAHNLRHIGIDANAMSFAASWPPGRVAQADLTQPPPTAQQSLQQVQAYDQQHAQMMSGLQAQNAQVIQQATPAPAPAIGGR